MVDIKCKISLKTDCKTGKGYNGLIFVKKAKDSGRDTKGTVLLRGIVKVHKVATTQGPLWPHKALIRGRIC